jgi:nitrite reductase/ring-hydroxylating ferredoxin subunit
LELRQIARTNEVQELTPLFREVDGARIAIYRFNGGYRAYLNQCPHQGGPACEGSAFKHVGASISENGSAKVEVSNDTYDIACPWHGIEYSLDTGICNADKRFRLPSFELVVKGEDIFVKK